MNREPPSDTAIVEALGDYFQKGYSVTTIDDDVFYITAASGSIERVDGIHLSFIPDDALDFNDLSPERQREEIDFEHICELVTRYRFRFDIVLTNERFTEIQSRNAPKETHE